MFAVIFTMFYFSLQQSSIKKNQYVYLLNIPIHSHCYKFTFQLLFTYGKKNTPRFITPFMTNCHDNLYNIKLFSSIQWAVKTLVSNAFYSCVAPSLIYMQTFSLFFAFTHIDHKAFWHCRSTNPQPSSPPRHEDHGLCSYTLPEEDPTCEVR